jgi:methylated-DNA-[protein]-cysteine S-methyltransferase
MLPTGFALFDTALGICGIAWGPQGLLGCRLPPAHAHAMRQRCAQRGVDCAEGSPPAAVARVIADIQRLLGGEPVDLRHARLDMSGLPDFNIRAYALARDVPCGQTVTYGELAQRLGEPDAARAVGQAMGANPFPIIVPCHRVLAAGGRAGGFSAPGGVHTKLRLLAIERARTGVEPSLFD